MRTSRRLLQQVRRALLVAFLFSAGINVLMLATPLYALQMFDSIIPSRSLEALAALSALAAAAVAAMALVEICRDRILLRSGLWLDHVLGQHVLEIAMARNASPSEMHGRADALATLRAALTTGTLVPLFDLPWVPVLLAVMWLLSPLLGLIATAICTTIVVAAMIANWATATADAETNDAYDRSQHWRSLLATDPLMAGALGLAKGAATQWERHSRTLVSSAYTAGKRAGFSTAIVRAVKTGGEIGCFGLGAWLVVGGELAPGALVAAIIILSRIIAPLEHLTSNLTHLRAAIHAYRRLRRLTANAPALPIEDDRNPLLGPIILSNITFHHARRSTPALCNINLVLQPGECLGIVGANGAGKSTLAALLAGAAVPTMGTAHINGMPITERQRASSQPPIGYLPDEPMLLEGSVHDNIARFQSASEAAVMRSAAEAGVNDTLCALQNGYDTMLGPAGGGMALRERRAVALARAVHGRPHFLVLDEPETGLDGDGVKRLIEALSDLKAGGIGLAIATRDPLLLGLADNLVMLAEGSVEAYGPRQQLLGALNGGTSVNAVGSMRTSLPVAGPLPLRKAS